MEVKVTFFRVTLYAVSIIHMADGAFQKIPPSSSSSCLVLSIRHIFLPKKSTRVKWQVQFIVIIPNLRYPIHAGDMAPVLIISRPDTFYESFELWAELTVDGFWGQIVF
jgi:hypothetical protein